LAYEYPGNVRELQHILERAITMCTEPLITVNVLPPQVRQNVREQPAEAEAARPVEATNGGESRLMVLEAKEQELIREAIHRNQGNLEQAAKDLGISRVTLWRRMKKFNIK
jgi:transcriptional regulator with PAS, ATPase and Fis domain